MRKILLTFFIFLIPEITFAEITFVDGKWETTFDCAEQEIITSVSCDDLIIGTEGADSQGNHSEISLSANNPLGEGAGYEQSDGFGGTVAGQNDSSERIVVDFRSSPEKEIWVRFYIQYPTNWESTNYQWDKIFYVNTDGGNIQLLLEPNSTGFRFTCQGGGTTTCSDTQTGYKLSDMLGGFYTGDGDWHCIEIHAKMDTDQTDGIAQAWVDDVLIIDADSVDISKGDVDALNGFSYISPSLNQAYITDVDGSNARVLMDDIVVYNTTPPNTDTEGNPYIGPIVTDPPEPSEGFGGISVGSGIAINGGISVGNGALRIGIPSTDEITCSALLLQDGGAFLLEDGTSALLLE